MNILLSNPINITRSNDFTGETYTVSATKLQIIKFELNLLQNNAIIICQYIDNNNNFVAGTLEQGVPDEYKIEKLYIDTDFNTIINNNDTIINNIITFLKSKYSFLGDVE